MTEPDVNLDDTSAFVPGLPAFDAGGVAFVPPQCWLCLHREQNPLAKHPACRAFLGGIPRAFQLNEIDHRTPHPDDGGVQFERDPNTDLSAYMALDRMFHNMANPG